MRKFLIVAAFAALAACKPAGPAPAEAVPVAGVAEAAPPVTSTTEVPANYDWAFMAHGGSGDLDFGDGDWAEGVSLFHLSCLPNSGKVEVSWGYPTKATLSSDGHSETFNADASIPAGHPVFTGLRSSRTLSLNQGGDLTVMPAKAAGQAAIDRFFNYCTTPLPPQ